VKISVLAFDLANNATGRADLLARLLAPRWQVEVVGPQFGAELWKPSQGGDVTHRALEAGNYPGFLSLIPGLVALVDGDVIVASKPRPTSYGVGLLARARRRRPLLLDIDDWEVGFFYRSGGWGRVGRALDLADPNGLTWTWLMERLVRRADARIVASRFLEARFGGAFVTHVRDTEAWDPARYDPAWARAALGAGGRRVVMFLGTPRGHKGVDDLVDAVGRLGPDVVLALVGAPLSAAAARRWIGRPHVRVVGQVPFQDVPRYLVAADVVAVPQRATTDTLGQVPAKLIDAMALARPVVSTAVSMIPEMLAGCGRVVAPGDVAALADAIRDLLAHPAEAAALGAAARRRCEERYSFRAARAALFPLIERLLPQRSME
jgi:glycosyltransferase involved in cell wall biosynthesis